MMICHSNSNKNQINLEYVKYLNLIYLQTKMKNELYHSIRDNKLQKTNTIHIDSETLKFTCFFKLFFSFIFNDHYEKKKKQQSSIIF